MQQLIEGLHRFQENVFSSQQELFARLAEGQSPETLFITCSDSRIDPNLLTQTKPGDLFVIRNAGNIVPPYGAANGGEGATIEYAVAALGVKNIIVCGHSHCGAMKGLLHPESLTDLPQVAQWLGHAEATRRIMKENFQDIPESARLTATVEQNVLIQMENLRTHPAVAAQLGRGQLNLYGWVYKFETGEVFAYDPEEGQFLPAGQKSGASAASATPASVGVTAGI